jgi:uncharacterized protein YlzI (FlbEa/FlbD family)
MPVFLHLTDLQGSGVWVNPELVETISCAADGATVRTGSWEIAVAEPPETIVELLRTRISGEDQELVRRLLLVQDTLTHNRTMGTAETERLEAEEAEVIERLRRIVGMPLPSDSM